MLPTVFLLLRIWISSPVINRGNWINKSKQFEIPSTWKRHYVQCVYCLSANRRLWIWADMLWGGVHRTYLCISGMCDKDLFVFNDHQWFTMNRCENWVNHITYMVFESFKQCQWVYNKMNSIVQHPWAWTHAYAQSIYFIHMCMHTKGGKCIFNRFVAQCSCTWFPCASTHYAKILWAKANSLLCLA